MPGELLSRSVCPSSIGHQMSRQMLEESVEDLLAAPKRSPLWQARTKHSRFCRRSCGALIGYLRCGARRANRVMPHDTPLRSRRASTALFLLRHLLGHGQEQF